MKKYDATISITGNIHCNFCNEWIGKNLQIDNPPYVCPYCGRELHVPEETIKYYQEEYDEDNN